jgi:hypothetical protein
MAHRDILQRGAISVANGEKAEVEGWAGPAWPVAFDPLRTKGQPKNPIVRRNCNAWDVLRSDRVCLGLSQCCGVTSLG